MDKKLPDRIRLLMSEQIPLEPYRDFYATCGGIEITKDEVRKLVASHVISQMHDHLADVENWVESLDHEAFRQLICDAATVVFWAHRVRAAQFLLDLALDGRALIKKSRENQMFPAFSLNIKGNRHKVWTEESLDDPRFTVVTDFVWEGICAVLKDEIISDADFLEVK